MDLVFAPSQVKSRPIARLRPYARNAKLHGQTQVAKIAASMAKFGWTVPCKEGFILWMDHVMLLKDAQNVEEAYKFLDFIMLPENAAMISAFAGYANGIAGSEAFMPEDMKDAPELVIPAEFADKGVFMGNCSPKAVEYITAIWTELQK